MTTTISKQILINARALFATEENWIKDELYNLENTAWCLEGALEVASRRLSLTVNVEDEHAAFEAAWSALTTIIYQRCGPSSQISLPHYNDAPTTTFENVTTLLDDAIQSCDA